MSGSGAEDALTGRFRDYCEQYLGITRALGDAWTQAAAAGDAAQRTRAFGERLAALQQQLAGAWSATPFGAPLASAAPFGAGAPFAPYPFATPPFWPPGGVGAQAFSAPGAFGASAMGAGTGAGPALGPAREQQALWERVLQLTADCARAQARLGGHWNQVVATALEELAARLAARPAAEASPEALRRLYDEWVDVAESVYGRAARTPEFAAAQAELSNAISRLRSAQRELIERAAREYDLPTRSELNAMQRQLRELRQAVRALEERLARGATGGA